MSESDDDAADRDRVDPSSAIPKGAFSRGFKASRALVGALGRVAGERLFGDASGAGAKAGESLADTLGRMKGLSMKLGQMLSYADLQAPEGFRNALSHLQHQSTAMPPDVVASTVEEELGRPPHVVFAEWDPKPIAAASIGQVHRARLHQGNQVAVKVRYPAIDRVVSDDLKNVGLMRRVFGLAAPELDTRALMEELHERFLDECDYLKEAENQRMFREFFLGSEGVIVPEVHREYCARRVLTTELIHGRRFEEFSKAAPQRERNRAARTIHDFAFRSIYQMGVLNCDPHPGNYLFTPAGVAFLDFGCVRRFSDELVRTWRTMLKSALEQDRASFSEAVVRIGLATRRADFDFDAHYGLYLYLIRPWLTDDASSLGPEFVGETYRALLVSNPNRRRLKMPRELLFANRLQWGLYSVLAQLGSTVSLRQAILDILYEPGESRPEPFSESELRRYLSDHQRRS